MPVRRDSSFCRGRPAHLRNISPRKGPILGTTFQLDAACGQSPADGSACTSNEACKCRNPKLTTFRLLGTRHTAYASLARETRRSNLRGISKTKSERVRRTWIPTSLITSYSSVPSVERTIRTQPRRIGPDRLQVQQLLDFRAVQVLSSHNYNAGVRATKHLLAVEISDDYLHSLIAHLFRILCHKRPDLALSQSFDKRG